MRHLKLGSLLLIGLAAACPASWPGDRWPAAAPAELGVNDTPLLQAREYALTGEGSGCIIVQGRLVMCWGDQTALYDLKSSSKAIGVAALGLALKDGKVELDAPATNYHPAFGVPPDDNAQTGWLGRITLRMLANQTAGFDKPGGYERLLFAPGTQWHYSDGGPNWLAECLTLAYGRDLNDVLFERVFTAIGISTNDLRWRQHAYRPNLIHGVKRREFGSGFSANVQAMARIGYLYLREGRWEQQQILPREFVNAVRRPGPELVGLPVRDPKQYGRASAHYGLLWWNNADWTIAGLPRDAYWSWGLFESLILVVPSLDLVAARAGKSWKRAENAGPYEVLKPFVEPLAAAVRPEVKTAIAPPSPIITRITRKRAFGSARPTNSLPDLSTGNQPGPKTSLNAARCSPTPPAATAPASASTPRSSVTSGA